MTGFLRCAGNDLEVGIAGERNLSDLSAGFGLLLEMATEEAFIHTVTGAALRQREDAKARGFGGRSQGQFGRVRGKSDKVVSKISVEEYERRYGHLGVRKIDEPIAEGLAELRAERKRQEIFRDAVFARAESDAHLVAAFVAGEAAVTIEPANLALTLWALPARAAVTVMRLGPRLGPIAIGGILGLRDFILTQVPIELQDQADGMGREIGEIIVDFAATLGIGSFVESVASFFGISRRTAGRADARGAEAPPNVTGRGKAARARKNEAPSFAESVARLPADERAALHSQYALLMEQGRVPQNQSLVDFLKALDELAGRTSRTGGDTALRPATLDEMFGSGVAGNALSGAVGGVLYEPEDLTVDDRTADEAAARFMRGPSFVRSLAFSTEQERARLLDGLAAGLAEERIEATDEVLLLMRLLDQDNEINRRPPNSGFGSGPTR